MGNYFISLIIKPCHQRRRRPPETPAKEKRSSRTSVLSVTTSTLTTPDQISRVLTEVIQPPRKVSHTLALSRVSRERHGRMARLTSISSHPLTTHLAMLWLSLVSQMPRTELMSLLTSNQTPEELL